MYTSTTLRYQVYRSARRLRERRHVSRWGKRTIAPRPAWGLDFVNGYGWRLRSHY